MKSDIWNHMVFSIDDRLIERHQVRQLPRKMPHAPYVYWLHNHDA